MNPAETVLAHYGVKGMKWGKRKSEPTSVTTTAVPGKRVKAKGGTLQPASDDAVRAAASKQRAKKSTTDSLSNKELQELVTRMNLEQQYARLAGPSNPAKKFVVDTLTNVGKQQLTRIAQDQAAQQVTELLKKNKS